MQPETKLKDLVAKYRESKAYADLAPATKRNTEKALAKVAQFMDRPAKRLTRGTLVKLMDDMGPGAAYVFATRLRTIFAWGLQRELVEDNPLKGVSLPTPGEYRPWTTEELNKFLTCDDEAVGIALRLAFYTAQRMSDVVKMRWDDLTKDGAIYVRQKKTGVELYIPVHPKLRMALDAHPRRGDYIVCQRDGSRYVEDSFRKRFDRKREDLSLPKDLTFHGLRKTMASLLASKGATPLEIMHVGGWKSLKQVQHYCKGADQYHMAKAAFARLVA